MLRYARKLVIFACVLCGICVHLVNIVNLGVFYFQRILFIFIVFLYFADCGRIVL